MSFFSFLKKGRFYALLNILLILMLLILGVVFILPTSGYGVLLGPLGWVIALVVYRRNRWSYFAAAAWALACYQLANKGLAFSDLKRALMVLSILMVALSILLHEKLARQTSAKIER